VPEGAGVPLWEPAAGDGFRFEDGCRLTSSPRGTPAPSGSLSGALPQGARIA
jgi:hypothetical protein